MNGSDQHVKCRVDTRSMLLFDTKEYRTEIRIVEMRQAVLVSNK